MKEIKILLASLFKFIKINKTSLIILLIILIGALLRFYNFEEILRFNADQVRDAQTIDEMRTGDLPLYGPKAGGTKFKLGPAFYYLEYLSGIIFDFSPMGIALIIPILSTISIYLFYLLFKKVFITNISLALTFLYATSFFNIKYSHFAWNPNLTPLFILAFLLLLLKFLEKKFNYCHATLLGIILGIGIQLHTTLLILMPITSLVVIIFYYIKNKKIEIKSIILSLVIILLLNFPLFYGDWVNDGKNIGEFFSGSEAKTNSDSSILKNISTTTQFFLQGATYHLSGIEPQKNWFNILKLIKSKNTLEITMFLVSLIVFIFGIFGLIKKYLNKKTSPTQKNTLLLLSAFVLLSLVIFIFIGNELNIRFFIILLFLPYLLLGFTIKQLGLYVKLSGLKTALFFMLISSLLYTNFSIFIQTYNLENYTAQESSYGGISLGELDSICLNIKQITIENDLQEAYIEDFEFKRSLEYVCTKNYSIILKFLSKEEIKKNNNFIAIVEKANLEKNLDYYKDIFFLKNSIEIKRFNLLYFTKK